MKTNIGSRGVIGVIEGGRPGKTIALRADFDEQAMLIGGKLLLSLVNSYVRDEKESLHHVEVKSIYINKTTIGYVTYCCFYYFCKERLSKYVL